MPPRSFVSVMCERQKFTTKKWSATAWAWFSIFFEKPLVNRVNRRICIRMPKVARST